jgi:ribosomal protein S12 methylthiotransferase
VIPLMAEGRILPYLDIPLQHASPRILKAMRRPANQEKVLERIRRWREICPDLTIRSSFIVGFPGETEAEFEELLNFIEEAGIDRAGCFKYENVEGAPSRSLGEHIDEEEKQERWERFMEAQSQLADARGAATVGSRVEVLVDAWDDEALCWDARTKADAPDIDGVVHVHVDQGALSAGDFATVEIYAAAGHELDATLVP